MMMSSRMCGHSMGSYHNYGNVVIIPLPKLDLSNVLLISRP